mgnify:CR=1 FL=1
MGEASPRFGNGFARLGSPGVLKTTHTASAPLSRRTDSFLRDLIDSCIPIPLDEVEDTAHDRPAGPLRLDRFAGTRSITGRHVEYRQPIGAGDDVDGYDSNVVRYV